MNGVATNYFTENSNIIFEVTNGNVLYYMRTDEHDLIGFKYNNETYYYKKNYQGDILGIYNSNYELVCTYEYDSYGSIVSIKDALGQAIEDANHIANINPYRYRSYYYDKETKLYYLNSRYYNPLWGRFINADGIIGTSESYLGYNLYVYCENSPIINIDSEGNFAIAAAGATIAFGVLALGAMYYGTKALQPAVGAITHAVDNAISKTKTRTRTKNKEKTDSGTKIYRWGGSNPSNLTPRKTDTNGLSFTTIKPTVKSVTTTIEEINATGILFAIEDKPGHVSVKPVGATMEDWINQGSASLWTFTLKNLVVKWDLDISYKGR